ncbi:DUF4097 family beta strand repeat-containing protein [Streptomyces sp. NPDC089922]|uniref:DUF4097 family beta strand repeat-containing protein n=1 Tax=unclassified Streptomyces TaxID=2593676 RepID=UPI0034471E15
MSRTYTADSTARRPTGRRGRLPRAIALLVGALLVGTAGYYLLAQLTARDENGSSAVPAQVRNVEIVIDSGAVSVTAAAPDAAGRIDKKLTKSLRAPDEKIEQDGDTLRVTTRCGDGWGKCSSDYDVAVAPGTRVKVVTDLGDVSVTGLRGPVEARTDVGKVSLKDVEADTVVAFGKTGGVSVRDTRFRTAELGSKLGLVEVAGTDRFERLKATTKTGDVRLTLPAGAGPFAVTAETSLGDRTVDVPQDSSSAVKVEASTSVGDVTVSGS